MITNPSKPILSFSYLRICALAESLARAGLAACFGGAASADTITTANTIRNFILNIFGV